MTHSGLPAKDIAVEAEPVFRQVKTALEQDVLLQCTRVVCGEREGQKHQLFPSDTKVSTSHSLV